MGKAKDNNAIVKGLIALCHDDGDVVTLHTPFTIGVDANWTHWKEERFTGCDLLDAIGKALQAKDRSERQ